MWVGWTTRITTLEDHLEKGVLGLNRQFSFMASQASSKGIFYASGAWHSSNTVPTNGLRPGFPHYESGTPGAFTAESIPLSATGRRTSLLCGSSRLPPVNTSSQNIHFKTFFSKFNTGNFSNILLLDLTYSNVLVLSIL